MPLIACWLLACCAADCCWTGAIGLLLGSVVDSLLPEQGSQGSKTRAYNGWLAGSWAQPSPKEEEQPPLASPPLVPVALDLFCWAGWAGLGGPCPWLPVATTADPLVPDVQLEEFGCGRSQQQQAVCRGEWEQMERGQLAPSCGWNAPKQHESRGQLLVSSTNAILEDGKKEKGRNTYQTHRVSVVIWLGAASPAMAVMPSATAAISHRTGG